MELRANQQQWRASWQHYGTTGSVWGLVLMNARLGLLAPDWRDTLSPEAHYAAGFPRPTDPAMLDGDALAIYEVATSPPAAWEPHATGGDWRQALTAWKVDAEDLQRHQFRTKRWLSDMTLPAGHQSTAVHLDAVLEARALDGIEASYRAGLAAGGDAEDWRGWYRRRITETWSADDDYTYKLFYSAERVGAALDSGKPIIPAADTITILEDQLPEYWREGEPQP